MEIGDGKLSICLASDLEEMAVVNKSIANGIAAVYQKTVCESIGRNKLTNNSIANCINCQSI